jgi:cellulose biosynthesis protein BcsQ
MKIVAIHSQKGGVGKTTVALLFAKYAAGLDRSCCVVDFDFIGSGVSDLLSLKRLSRRYLEHFFLSADPTIFDVRDLLASYSDTDLGEREVCLILNLTKGLPVRKDQKSVMKLERDFLGLIATDEPYGEVSAKADLLFRKLEKEGTDLAIVDCHPGLGFLSKCMRKLADLNVFITTPNRADCFGLLKAMNLDKKLDRPSSMLLFNRADRAVTDVTAFRALLEGDGVLGNDFVAIFAQLGHVGRKAELFAPIRESKPLRLLGKVGETGYVPPIRANAAEFRFCRTILSRIDGQK